MIAQDIWNEYRNSSFQLNSKIEDMIIDMKGENSNILAEYMNSSGPLGMSMLLSKAYNEQQYDLASFLLKNGAEIDRINVIKNPEFLRLNQLFDNYSFKNNHKECFYKDLRDIISLFSSMEYTDLNKRYLEVTKNNYNLFYNDK
jgi:hypothetical protein